MIPHHPTSAELATFRRRIHNANPDADWRIGPDAPCYVNDPPAAAWPDEQRDGIGWRYGASPTPRTNVLGARRRADDSRRRAFGYHPDAFGAVQSGAMACELAHGTPTAAWDAPDWWDCNR